MELDQSRGADVLPEFRPSGANFLAEELDLKCEADVLAVKLAKK